MMDHARYRSTVLADPHAADPELRAHRDSCAECSLYTERLLRFEAQLQRALRIALPARRAPRWLALAASVLIGLVLVGAIWLGAPARSLAAAVVTHMAAEPQAWDRTVETPALQVKTVLQEAGLRLNAGAGLISYANSCDFRGHVVPHLVLQTPSGPATVLVLVHESVRKPMNFEEQGYRGTIVPVAGHGSIAVLTRGPLPDTDVAQIAAQVLAAMVWTN